MSEKKYPTAHINADPKDIAKTVLMPGDPLRAKFIAENFLESPVLFNNVRGVQGYTGRFNSTRVSVMASGMGIPSMGIYSYELFNFFGVENIIRIGSAGALRADVGIHDIVLGMGACTNSCYAAQYGLQGTFAPIASYKLLSQAINTASWMRLKYHVGNLLSSDTFYGDSPEAMKKWADMGVLAVEMEAAALYMNAAQAGKNALAVCTVTNSLVTGEETTSEERQSSLTDMIRLALEMAVAL